VGDLPAREKYVPVGNASCIYVADASMLTQTSFDERAVDEREARLRGFHERHGAEVYAFLARLLRDRALAEDVLQETFLQVYVSLDRFDDSRPFRPWVFRIARNAALMALRVRRKDERADSHGTPGGDAVPPLDAASSTETRARVREVLDRLPDETRALLLQRHASGMKLEELASSLACTERTVRKRLHAAAEAFARALFSTAPGGKA